MLLDPGPWWLRHACAEIKAGVRRLIVRNVLPGNAQTVLRIVHQRIEAILSRYNRGVNVQLFIVRRAPDHFFPPIAQNICTQCGRCFGPIIRSTFVSL